MNKVCVVTGGAAGIGRCIVEMFAESGYTVYFIDKTPEAVELAEGKMSERGLSVTGFVGDIAEEQTLRDFVDFVLSIEDQIDCLINNACLTNGGILSNCSYEDFLYVQRVGVAAPYFLALSFKDYFSGAGAIVNISSTRAFQSQANTESYTAAKGGITALTHALAVSLSGIARVNSIAPGWIDTGSYHEEDYVPSYTEGDIMQHPSQRVGEPADIARAVLFLCDERNSFINGENITIDGGMSKLMIYHNEKLVGQQIGVSDYVELSQERINLFADATLDHQWIHVDTERAKTESHFKTTIAHGYLTLSMLPYLWNQIIEVNNLKMMVNYGMDQMKFGQAVLSGQSIRLVAKLHSLTNLRGVAKAEIKFTIEIKDQPKKALDGIAVFLYYFN